MSQGAQGTSNEAADVRHFTSNEKLSTPGQAYPGYPRNGEIQKECEHTRPGSGRVGESVK